jgi:hypothetical protein
MAMAATPVTPTAMTPPSGPPDTTAMTPPLHLPSIGAVASAVTVVVALLYGLGVLALEQQLEHRHALDAAAAWQATFLVPRPTIALHALRAITTPLAVFNAILTFLVSTAPQWGDWAARRLGRLGRLGRWLGRRLVWLGHRLVWLGRRLLSPPPLGPPAPPSYRGHRGYRGWRVWRVAGVVLSAVAVAILYVALSFAAAAVLLVLLVIVFTLLGLGLGQRSTSLILHAPVWASVVAGLIAALGMLVLQARGVVRHHRLLGGLALVYAASLVTGYFDFGAQRDLLPAIVVTRGDGAPVKGTLLAHADGYWYVVGPPAQRARARVLPMRDAVVRSVIIGE